MGCICSKPHIEITLPARKITNLPDLHYSSGFFIQRNYSSFHSIYTLLPDPLGIGPYGEVRQCKHILTDALRAVKILNKLALPKNVIHQGGIINQIKILKSLDHPNIMRVFEFFEDDAAYYLVEEYYPGNDLHKAIMKIKKYDEKHACEIMKQIFSAVSYLHSKKVAHRDLKPENIIIDDEDCNYIGVKVIDFDSASFFKDNEPLKGFYGTTYYMAPEVISGEYTEKCDI